MASIHPESRMADLRIVPHGYRKAMGDTVLKDLADKIGRVSQALDPTAPDPPLTYDQLGTRDPDAQLRYKDAARCAVRWGNPDEHRDAALRLRQELASRIFAPILYHQLTEDEQEFVQELADGALATLRLHFEGRMSPLVPEERAELTGSKVQVVMGGESA